MAGALCLYLLFGLFFATLYGLIANLTDPPSSSRPTRRRRPTFIYFSFITLTTTGYGDYTAAHDLGRMLAVTEALFGQLYLVSAVALLIGSLGRTRRRGQAVRAGRPRRARGHG